MIYHHLTVHSTGINLSDTIRMSCIQDFSRMKPRSKKRLAIRYESRHYELLSRSLPNDRHFAGLLGPLCWGVEGGSVRTDGTVEFESPAADGGDGDGGRRCSLLWHHDTIEGGVETKTQPAEHVRAPTVSLHHC